MKLKNPFKRDIKNNFLYVYSCFDCGRSDRGLELHHIIGRKSDSKLNAIPLCLKCHSKCGHSKAEESKYLQIMIRYYLEGKVILNGKDIDFYEEYKDLYD